MSVLVSVVLPLSLAFIMFALGVGLTVQDFVRVGKRPAAFLTGALNQIILLPIVAFIVVIAFGLTKEIAVGVMVMSACPGGVTTAVFARFGNGDVALSVSLTAVISLVGVLTIPLILGLSMVAFMGQDAPDISLIAVALRTFAITVVPIAIGMICKSLFPERMTRSEPLFSKISIVLLAIIIIAVMVENWSIYQTNFTTLAPALATLLIVLAIIGFVVPRLMGRDLREAKTISIETSIQNTGLGVAVAAGLSGGTEISPIALPAAVYGPLMLLMIVPVIFLFRRIG